MYGARISLTVGVLGVTISLFLGVLIGGAAGYFGGRVDNFVQRLTEVAIAIPSLPLWMALSASLPTWRFLALREEEFVMAARLSNCSEWRIITRHMVPSVYSHIIASATLAIPAMILAETALSFLGIGLRAPVISWGVLMQEAQNIHSVALYPWLLVPGLFVILTVLAFSFVGDGLRDAADPHGHHV
jgi:peptide/nickel transport system permease protein